MSDSLRSHELQRARLPCPSPTPGVHPNPCPLSQWCHPTMSSSVIPFSYCPQSFPASDQMRSVTQSCPTLWDPMHRSMPGLPVHYQLPEFTQTHVHWVSDAIQPYHPLSSPSPPAPNPSQHQSFSNESTLRMRWPKYWSFSFSIIPSKEIPGWSPSEWTGWISLQSKGLSRVFSNTTVQKHQGLLKWVSSSHQVAKYWSFSFNISPSNEHPGLISFRMDRLDFLVVQGTLKSFLQHHS